VKTEIEAVLAVVGTYHVGAADVADNPVAETVGAANSVSAATVGANVTVAVAVAVP